MGTEDTSIDSTDTTASTEQVTETPSIESSQPDEFAYNLDSVPENIREEVKKHVEATKKDILKSFYSKSEAIANERKSYEAEKGNLTSRLERLNALAKDVLTDPSKIESYRNVYGKEFGIVAGNVPRENETVEQFENRIKADFDMKLNAQKMQTQYENRWKDAWDDSFKNPDIKESANLIYALIKDPQGPFLKQYNGSNERALIDMAYKEVERIATKKAEVAKKEALKTVEKKKLNQTLSPTKTMSSEVTGKKSKKEIIAEVRAEMGE